MRRPSTLRRTLLGLASCVVLLVLVTGGTAFYLAARLNDHLHRVPAFTGLADRPTRGAGAAARAVNILLLGTDRRSAVPTTGSEARSADWVAGEQRSDSIMVVHVAADRRSVDVISVPRDSWVPIPGHGRAKVNAAFSYGGARLAVATVEELTGVRLDHVAIVDWSGFEAMTDALGGVDVDVPNTVHDSAHGITWPAGRHHLDGAAALDYVGQRHGLPAGDLDRVRRQQAVLRSLLATSLRRGTLTNPRALYRLLDIVARHLTVDDGWSTRDMARLGLSLQSLRSSDVHYLTVPVSGFGKEGAQSVVRLAERSNAALWRAVRNDTTDAWRARNAPSITPPVVE